VSPQGGSAFLSLHEDEALAGQRSGRAAIRRRAACEALMVLAAEGEAQERAGGALVDIALQGNRDRASA
jgi:hypothetical protein